MQDQSNLDLRLLRVWMKASKAVVENFRKDIESHKINNENFMILEQLIDLLKRIEIGAEFGKINLKSYSGGKNNDK